MTPQELKNSILQLAIQGKLVEQRPEEGTAEELYREIQAEKQRLIKAGKLKREKLLPEITEDEKPFEIPESWKWVRVANIWKIFNGDRGKNYPAKTSLSHSGIPFISALNLNGKTVVNDDNLLCLSESQYEKLNNGKLIQGDIVVCIRGSLGKHGRYPFKQGAIASSLVIMRSNFPLQSLDEYLMYYLDSPLFFGEIKKYDNGTAQPNLAAKSLEQFLFPLPPLAEQKRIVAKIEELLPYIDRYEQAWSRLEAFNQRFPDDMRKSILQLAIQGKLVEQRPEECTGDELYREIQAEKQQLIKEGKIKKEKLLPEIAEDEKPFEIPESWKWVRFNEVIEVATNLVPPEDYLNAKHIAPDNIEKGTGRLLECRTVSQDKVSSPNHLFKSGQLLYSKIRPLLRKVVIAPFDGLCSADMYPLKTHLYVDYVKYYMLSSAFNRQIATAMSSRVKMPKVNQVELSKTLVPLPPLSEQKRIVAKLDELLPLCDRLK